jgi:DUF1009 family protein
MTAIGILAGGGRLPLLVAEAVTAAGGRVHILALEGDADPQVARFPHTWVNIGAFGRMLSALRAAGAQDLVIAGGIRRPDLRRVRPDLGLVRLLPKLVGILAGGDNAVLTQVVRLFESEGLRVRGAHEVAPDLLAPAGRMGALPLPSAAEADAAFAFGVMAALAPLDAGQAAVVAGGQVLAIEGAEGTDAMLQRVAELRSGAGGASPAASSGVLAKGPKRGQELRVDMPAVGPRTITGLADAGLAGLALEAGGVLVLDRDEVLQAADACGIAIEGVAPALRVNAGGPEPFTARLAGRHRPRRRDRADMQKGLAAAACLVPFRTGASNVVARGYALAFEAVEGTSAMLDRARRQRQWGLRGPRSGGLTVRLDGPEDPDALALIRQAAGHALAGVAFLGPPPALAAAEEAVGVADAAGLFLATVVASSATGP